MARTIIDIQSEGEGSRRFRACGDSSVVAHRPRIAVIGTRSPTPEGIAAIRGLVYTLRQLNPSIISGGAIGSDLTAHQAAVENDLPTVAVLPCGIARALDHHRALLNFSRTLLLSEFADKVETTRQTPVIRNHTIAELAQVVVVFEAGAESGTLHCVRDALELGRPVFFLSSIEQNPKLQLIQKEIIRRGGEPFTFQSDLKELVGRIAAKLELEQGDDPQLSLFDRAGEVRS